MIPVSSPQPAPQGTGGHLAHRRAVPRAVGEGRETLGPVGRGFDAPTPVTKHRNDLAPAEHAGASRWCPLFAQDMRGHGARATLRLTLQ